MLQQLSELRWCVPEWEHPFIIPPTPDLSPLLHATSLRVLQLAHVRASCEAQVRELRARLPALRTLQVNSAFL